MRETSGLIIVSSIVICIIALWMVLISPLIEPWWAQQTGKAELARAEQNRQIQIIEAEAENTASTSKANTKVTIAKAEAQAEIERAKGVAEANKIIGDSLRGNEDYLRYLYVTGVTNQQSQIIYVPTEAGLPILEASRVK